MSTTTPRPTDTEEQIQADIRAMLPELHATRARLLELRDRAAVLPGYEAAEAVNRTAADDEMTCSLALRLRLDLEQAAGPDPAAEERAFDENSISAVISYLSRAALETEETARASWGGGPDEIAS